MNRSPYGGRVVDVTHTPGRFLAAYRAESATKNERSEIIVERVVGGAARRVVYRQLVGPARAPHRDPHRAGRRDRHGRSGWA